jgi:hypothetical protein
VVTPMAHFVHCPGGPINKLSVKMANGRWTLWMPLSIHKYISISLFDSASAW